MHTYYIYISDSWTYTEGVASVVIGGIDRNKCSDESTWSWTTAIASTLAFPLKSIRSVFQFIPNGIIYCNFISTNSTAVISTGGFGIISLMGTFSLGPNEEVGA
jgi:hypothetical protein